MSKKIPALFLTFFYFNLFAGGGEGPSSLIPAFFNFTILLIILVKYVFIPVAAYFREESVKFEQKLNSAEQKQKDAKMLLESAKTKLKNITLEENDYKLKLESSLKSFKEKEDKNFQERLHGLKQQFESLSHNIKEKHQKTILSEYINDISLEVSTSIVGDQAADKNFKAIIMGKIS